MAQVAELARPALVCRLVNGEAWGYSPTRPLWPIPWDLLWFRGYVKPEGA
jgi:hypothetical protein